MSAFYFVIFSVIGFDVKSDYVSQNSRYVIHDTLQTWNDQNTYCQNTYGSNLASVHSTQEEDELINLILAHGEAVVGGPYIRGFVGLTVAPKVWVDATSLDFPITIGTSGDGNCVEWNGRSLTTGGYNDLSCNEKHYGVCNNGPTSSPSQYPSLNPSNNPTSTPSQYPSLNPSNNPTATPSKYPSLNPSNNPTPSPSQSSLNPSNNPTSSPSQYPSLNPSNNPTNPTSTPSQYPLNPGDYYSQNSRYVLHDTPQTWNDQKTYCQNAYGSNLASVHSKQEEDELINLILDHGESVVGGPYIRGFVGLTVTPKVWVDGTNLDFPITIGTSGDGNCVEWNGRSLTTGGYNDLSCNELHYGVCNNPGSGPSQYPSLNPSNNPTSTPSKYPSLNPSNNPSLNPSNNPTSSPSQYPSLNPSNNPTSNPSQYPSLNPSDYVSQNSRYVLHDTPQTWTDQNLYCQNTYGSNLASVHSTQEEDELINLILDHGESVVGGPYIRGFVGLTVTPRVWVDGTNLDFPITIESSGDGNCVEWNGRSLTTGGYNDLSCNELHYGVCNNPTSSPSQYPSLNPSNNPTSTPSQYPSLNPGNNHTSTPSQYPSLLSTPRTNQGSTDGLKVSMIIIIVLSAALV